MSSTMQIDSATTPRAIQIAQIIKKRRPLAQKIETVEINLKTLSAALRQLEKQQALLLSKNLLIGYYVLKVSVLNGRFSYRKLLQMFGLMSLAQLWNVPNLDETGCRE